MNRLKQHYWLTSLFFLFVFKVLATNTTPSTSNASRVDSVYFHVSSATADVGQTVSLDVKVGNFTDIYNLALSLQWNRSYMQFQSITNIAALPGLSLASFNTINALNTGKVDLNYTGLGSSLADSTVLFTINLKVISYSGVPATVFIPFVTVTSTCSTCQVTGRIFSGAVKINPDGSCSGVVPGTNCSNAPLLCAGDFPYCRTLSTTENIPFPALCGSIENGQLFYFIAGTSDITFRVSSVNCSGGPRFTGSGVQFRVYENLNCQPSPCKANKTIAQDDADDFIVSGLVPGQRYLLVVDGQLFDVCDYKMDITSGSIGGKPVLNASSISGPATSCPNQKGLEFTTPARADALSYEWEVNNGATIVSGQGTNTIKVNWGNSAGKVFLKIIGTCGESNIAEKNISLSTPVVNNIAATICKGSSYTIGSKTVTAAGSHTETIVGGAISGCDSIINLDLTVIDIMTTASKSGDITCATPSVTLNNATTVLPNTATTTYEWRNASNAVVGTTPSVSVTQGGVYTLVVKATINGVTCEKSSTVTVTKSGNQPTKPELRGDLATCENKTVNYLIVNPAADVAQFNWSVQTGTINSGVGSSTISVTWGAGSSGKVCVEAQNGCGKSDTTCLSVIIGKAPTIAPITNSTTMVCPNSSATYGVNATAGVNYLWSVPAGATIASGQGSNSIVVNWGNTGGQVCVTPSNSCGAATQSCVNVTVSNAVPDSSAMTAPATVCPKETASVSVTPNASITKYTWILPANVTLLSGQGTPSVSLRFDTGTEALITLEIENSCQLKRQQTKLVKIKAEVPTPLPILGNTAVCSTDTTTYGVSGNASITSYAWSIPTGATILSGQGTQSIRVIWGNVTIGKVCLEITNACGLKNQSCLDVVVKNGTIDNFTITGPAQLCPGASGNYEIPTNARYTQYNWILPSNATLNSGVNTNKVNITWNTVGVNNLCVEVTNDCNVKKRVCLSVEVKTGIDSLPITGPKEVCANGTGVYSLQKDPEALSYSWFVPTGAVIESGRGTNQVTIRFGSTGGIIRANAVGGCAANLSSYAVSIKKAPDAPTTITGNAVVCQNEETIYEFSAVVGATGYKWTAPTGALIVGSDSSQQVRVRWAGVTGGKLQVKSRNECAESVAKEFDVVVNRLPQPKAGADDSVCGLQYTLKGVSSLGNRTWRTLQKPSNGTLVFSDSTNATSRITATQSGSYVLQFEEKNDKCVAYDTVVIVFKANPKLTLVNDNCVNGGAQYILNVNINGGQLPYSIGGSVTGVVTNTNFVSAPQAEGAAYVLFFTDASGCKSDTLQGTKRCPCVSKAATLKSDLITVCEGTKGNAKVQISAILEPNDTFEYVIHDGTATTIGNILATNTTGEFGFDATKMSYNKTYFIHFLVGDNVNGRVSKTDRCYGESNGVPIIFRQKALVGLKGDTTVCANSNATVTFKTNQTGAFKIAFRNIKENSVVNIPNARNNTTSTVTPSVSTTYILFEATDEVGCPAQIGDSAIINVRPRLIGEAGVDQTVCIKTAQLSATIPTSYRATWRSLTGATIAAPNNASTGVSNLKNGKNTFVLTVQDSFCSNYRQLDSVSIFIPTIPNAVNLALEMFTGDTITSEVTEQAPAGTYSVTRLNNPSNGRFDLFSNGKFTYISDKNFAGIIKFDFQICSEACPGICDTGDVRILIRPKPAKPDTVVDVVVPNTITPNDDGKNDTWIINNIEKYPKGELTIFNRWGDILYRSKPYNNDWNGTNQQGQPLPEGTYYYVLRLDLNNGKVLRGDITILR